jgi:phospholipase A-2-activating protein
MAYKLCKELIGHEKDVRCCCSYVDESGEEIIVTGSRDKRIVVWKLTPLGVFEPNKIITSHANYVNCLCVIPPDLSCGRLETLLASGGADNAVHVHSLRPDIKEPLKVFTGHKDSVSGLACLSGVLVSVAWDGKLCIWNEVPLFEVAHIPSCYCVAGLEGSVTELGGLQGSFFLTGGADQAVKLWLSVENSVKMIRMYSGHTGTVRDIKVISKDVFFTVSNDQTMKQWNMQSGECLLSLLCHDSYIYSLSLFHEPSGNAITSGEDGTAKVWEGGVCAQTLVFPTQSIWSVHCLKNGDFVVGASDGKARVFTSDPTRYAPEDDLELFEKESLKFTSESGKSLDPQKFPGVEALKTPGKKHGDTQVVNNNNQLEVYQWNGVEWELIGHASGEKVSQEKDDSQPTRLQNGKWLYEGKEYDYVIPTEIEEDFGKVRKLQLPYNKSSESLLCSR